MKIVTVEQMQSIEHLADATGLTYGQMMANAGRGIAEWVYKSYPLNRCVIGLVGSGNNGGDTIIALTWLAKWGYRAIGFLAKNRGDDPLLEDLKSVGGDYVDLSKNTNFKIFEATIIPGSIVLDGILGTGFKLPLRGTFQKILGNIHNLLEKRLNVLKIAVDCPSGVECDSGETSKEVITADHTLVMAAMKQGLLKQPARSFGGEFHKIDIGIEHLTENYTETLPELVDKNLIQPFLPNRPANGHKGTFGTCVVFAGSKNFTGAAYLAGKAAYQAGCGLVHMVTTKAVYKNLAGKLIESIWSVISDDLLHDEKDRAIVQSIISEADSIVIGPGWGLTPEKASFLESLLEIIPQDTPTLIDADGLKLLAGLGNWWEKLPNQTILTPHPGEMSTLSGLSIQAIQSNRWDVALEYSQKWDVNLVLKGAMTVIANPSMDLFINPISDTSLATAGSGDVLSGIIGGVLAQDVSAHYASLLGVWLHSEAGVAARKKLGTDISVTALDVLGALPEAFVKAKEAGV